MSILEINIILYFGILSIGLLFGSFLYTTAIRLHQEESLFTASHCDFCERKVGIIGLIPVLGYLVRLGKCQYCKKPIHFSYPLFEIANGGLAVLIYYKTGWSLDFVHQFFLWETLLLVAVLDFRSYLIFPQPIIIGFLFQLLWVMFLDKALFKDALIGLFLGAGIFHFAGYFYQVIRNKKGLGEGDATLLGLIGMFWGWQVLFPVIFYGAALGIVGGGALLIYNRKNLSTEIPFAPWLVIAAFLVWLFPTISFFGKF